MQYLEIIMLYLASAHGNSGNASFPVSSPQPPRSKEPYSRALRERLNSNQTDEADGGEALEVDTGPDMESLIDRMLTLTPQASHLSSLPGQPGMNITRKYMQFVASRMQLWYVQVCTENDLYTSDEYPHPPKFGSLTEILIITK